MGQREQIVHDEPEPCPYINGEMARLPLRWQFRRLAAAAFDESLALGDRRVGRMLYRTACEACRACEPIRIPVASFAPTKSQRRVIKKNRDVVVESGPSTFTAEKLALYNLHKHERGLSRDERPMTRRGYEGWFVQSCTQTIDMEYRVDGRLIGCGILDLGRRDTSSVYFFFDPAESKRSLGVFSVLMEVAWLRSQGGRFHYLGLYVETCRHLSYKSAYYPHHRLVDGAWMLYKDRTAAARPLRIRATREGPHG